MLTWSHCSRTLKSGSKDRENWKEEEINNVRISNMYSRNTKVCTIVAFSVLFDGRKYNSIQKTNLVLFQFFFSYFITLPGKQKQKLVIISVSEGTKSSLTPSSTWT